jgi:hypothetical protein
VNNAPAVIASEDSATESETESDHEFLRASLQKMKARKQLALTQGTMPLGSTTCAGDEHSVHPALHPKVIKYVSFKVWFRLVTFKLTASHSQDLFEPGSGTSLK